MKEIISQANKLWQSGKLTEAIELLEVKAVNANPPCAELYFNLGALQAKARRHFDALDSFNTANVIGMADHVGLLFYNMGVSFKAMGNFNAAISSYREAIRHEPENPSFHNNLATTLLLIGQWEEGFSEWEHRLMAFDDNKRIRSRFMVPTWDGDHNKKILIYNEQGRGDAIQFARFIPQLKAKKITLEVREEMVPLLQGWADEVIAKKQPAEYDAVVSISSLPHLCKVTPETVPFYQLEPQGEPPLPASFWEKFKKLKVGICWAGSAHHPNDRIRSLDNWRFRELKEAHPDIEFFSLQKIDQKQSYLVSSTDFYMDLNQYVKNFNDLAHIINNLDLVISVDTAVAHLAGALQKPVWTLLPIIPDFRWMMHKMDTPWYPTMRLFRQRPRDMWQNAFDRLKDELRYLIPE